MNLPLAIARQSRLYVICRYIFTKFVNPTEVIYATADEADAYMFYICFFCFFVFFPFATKYQTTVLENG